ncbi:hypothetical protein L9F63_000911, partial [Diploptera punctata]
RNNRYQFLYRALSNINLVSTMTLVHYLTKSRFTLESRSPSFQVSLLLQKQLAYSRGVWLNSSFSFYNMLHPKEFRMGKILNKDKSIVFVLERLEHSYLYNKIIMLLTGLSVAARLTYIANCSSSGRNSTTNNTLFYIILDIGIYLCSLNIERNLGELSQVSFKAMYLNSWVTTPSKQNILLWHFIILRVDKTLIYLQILIL